MFFIQSYIINTNYNAFLCILHECILTVCINPAFDQYCGFGKVRSGCLAVCQTCLGRPVNWLCGITACTAPDRC